MNNTELKTEFEKVENLSMQEVKMFSDHMKIIFVILFLHIVIWVPVIQLNMSVTEICSKLQTVTGIL